MGLHPRPLLVKEFIKQKAFKGSYIILIEVYYIIAMSTPKYSKGKRLKLIRLKKMMNTKSRLLSG